MTHLDLLNAVAGGLLTTHGVAANWYPVERVRLGAISSRRRRSS